MQRINAENTEAVMRAQREEAQYTQRKQTQSANFEAYKIEQQANVGIAGAEALGNMGVNGGTEISGNGGMNPAGMMAGLAMGGVIGQNMAGIMNNMIGDVAQNSGSTVPPPIPPSMYNVAVNGQSTGPFDIPTLSQMIISGQITKDTLVWKSGMTNWEAADSIQELQTLFKTVVAPPIPTEK